MNNFCDTHGLDLPCKKCTEDRWEDIKFLEEWKKPTQNKITLEPK